MRDIRRKFDSVVNINDYFHFIIPTFLQLCTEVELRFKSKIGDLETKLKAVAEAFSCKEQRECTFVDTGKHLQALSRHALIKRLHCLMTCKSQHLTCIPPWNKPVFILEVLNKLSGYQVET